MYIVDKEVDSGRGIGLEEHRSNKEKNSTEERSGIQMPSDFDDS